MLEGDEVCLTGVARRIDRLGWQRRNHVHRWLVARSRVRTRGSRFFPGCQHLTEFHEFVARETFAHRGKEGLFLLLHVVADVLHEDRELRIEAFIARFHLQELGKSPLHDVVLLQRFEDVGGMSRKPFPGNGD